MTDTPFPKHVVLLAITILMVFCTGATAGQERKELQARISLNTNPSSEGGEILVFCELTNLSKDKITISRSRVRGGRRIQNVLPADPFVIKRDGHPVLNYRIDTAALGKLMQEELVVLAPGQTLREAFRLHDTRWLDPGQYSISFSHEATDQSAGLWNGRVQSNEVAFSIVQSRRTDGIDYSNPVKVLEAVKQAVLKGDIQAFRKCVGERNASMTDERMVRAMNAFKNDFRRYPFFTSYLLDTNGIAYVIPQMEPYELFLIDSLGFKFARENGEWRMIEQ